ncbi:hypothetical protein R3W88_001341 [Solanum pinnatisectum]|uniref:Uncharacterized protein n=1 Tax=Solanum pinnatisectum TaxID=50273 RepID=A0AAV9MKU1_9SOLN|nr:hypothetical protein R3W88_001341 [Solanum pinnatisectum]
MYPLWLKLRIILVKILMMRKTVAVIIIKILMTRKTVPVIIISMILMMMRIILIKILMMMRKTSRDYHQGFKTLVQDYLQKLSCATDLTFRTCSLRFVMFVISNLHIQTGMLLLSCT